MTYILTYWACSEVTKKIKFSEYDPKSFIPDSLYGQHATANLFIKTSNNCCQ